VTVTALPGKFPLRFGEAGGYQFPHMIAQSLTPVPGGNIPGYYRLSERYPYRRRRYPAGFLKDLVAAGYGDRNDRRLRFGCQFKRTRMEGKQSPAFTAVAFGEDQYGFSCLYPSGAVLDCSQTPADILSVDKESAYKENPEINKGNERQFFLRDKTNLTPRRGKNQQNIKIAAVITYKTEAAFWRNVFPAPYLNVTAYCPDKHPCPGLCDLAGQEQYGFFEAQASQDKER
jgi:hypothetical protein